MGLLQFDKLPINTLVGADWDTFKKITAGQVIGEDYKGKYRLTKAVGRLLSTLVPLQDKRYEKMLASKPLEMDPLFILGHWRSGTTFVHNVFACDKHFGYTTTYQTVFPNLMLWGQPFFKKNMSFLMPDHRPTDNLLFNDISEEERRIFKEAFLKLVKISLYNTQGSQYLSKNPPHTGRVKTLVEMFPNAKFIYLKRNPYTVFESTRSFFTNTIKPLMLQPISNEELTQNFVEVYKRLFYKFEEEKHLIPEGNLVELKFEDFEKDAYGMTEEIYRTLDLPNFAQSKTAIEAYLSKKKGYKKNRYKYEDATVRTVEENWGMALKEWGYHLNEE